MNIQVEIDINAPRISVWDTITDIKHYASIISAILKIEILDSPKTGIKGLKWKETRKIFGKEATETIWITETDNSHYYHTRAENHGAIYVTKLMLSEKDDTTRVHMSFEGHSDSLLINMIAWLMAPFMKKSMIKMLQQDLKDIKVCIEKRS